MAVANPDSGSFMTFATQAFGPGTGFVAGCVYWLGLISLNTIVFSMSLINGRR